MRLTIIAQVNVHAMHHPTAAVLLLRFDGIAHRFMCRSSNYYSLLCVMCAKHPHSASHIGNGVMFPNKLFTASIGPVCNLYKINITLSRRPPINRIRTRTISQTAQHQTTPKIKSFSIICISVWIFAKGTKAGRQKSLPSLNKTN